MKLDRRGLALSAGPRTAPGSLQVIFPAGRKAGNAAAAQRPGYRARRTASQVSELAAHILPVKREVRIATSADSSADRMP